MTLNMSMMRHWGDTLVIVSLSFEFSPYFGVFLSCNTLDLATDYRTDYNCLHSRLRSLDTTHQDGNGMRIWNWYMEEEDTSRNRKEHVNTQTKIPFMFG